MELEKIIEYNEIAIRAAKEAGAAIMDVYKNHAVSFSVKEDNSPLTLADKAAHNSIVEILALTNLPILSEEGKSIPYEIRKDWDYYWLIDPLDGTKEFLKRNGEFTVNIALIHSRNPILGVVFAPVLNTIYWGIKGRGAYLMKDDSKVIELTPEKNAPLKTIVASRSHLSKETEEFISRFPEANLISMGSSLKFLLVAEGKAQIYPRFAPTMEWDTAAAHAIIDACGGYVLNYPEMSPLIYNREDMLNGWFICGYNTSLI